MALTILYVICSIAVALLAGFGCYALWQTALTMKQTRKTAENVNKQIDKIDTAVTNATNAVNSVSRMVQKASDALEQPMEGIMKGINIAQKLIQKFREAGARPAAKDVCDNDDDCECSDNS